MCLRSGRCARGDRAGIRTIGGVRRGGRSRGSRYPWLPEGMRLSLIRDRTLEWMLEEAPRGCDAESEAFSALRPRAKIRAARLTMSTRLADWETCAHPESGIFDQK